MLEFLIKKYPPSKHKILDTDLAKHVKEVNRITEVQYDILSNAGISFVGNSQKTNYFR